MYNNIIHHFNSVCEMGPLSEVSYFLFPGIWSSLSWFYVEFSLVGTIAALLQEIVNIYPVINPPNLTVSYKLFTSIYVL